MQGKLLFVAGVAAGYVVGARAGRPAYDRLTARLRHTAESPAVQQAGAKAKAVLEEKAPGVAGVAGQVAETAVSAARSAADAPAAEQDGSGSDTEAGPSADSGESTPRRPGGQRRAGSAGSTTPGSSD